MGSQRVLRWTAAVLSLALTASYAQAAHHSEGWARGQFAAAGRAREALNGRPAQDRTRREYQRAISAYRRVYYGAPASAKADPSVVAVAELLEEMGRRFEDAKILRSAIGQYEFLRREYPGSRYRFDALFTIGEIYKDDLNDSARARAAFEEFLRRYPRHHLAEEARKGLAEEKQQASVKTAGDGKPDSEDSVDPASTSSGEQPSDVSATANAKLPRITGIRHWSTPDYTRVAIDLEQDVKFDSQRIANPDRIFFDLRDTRLASTLIGKSFDVDDGFLKRIRVAQFGPGRSRIVLEVDDLSDYNAFLLPNPSRLIIDIHGKESPGGLQTAVTRQHSSSEPSAGRVMGPQLATSEVPASARNRQTANSGIKTKIVEADDDGDDNDVAPAEVRRATKTTDTEHAMPKTSADRIREARPTARGDRSLIRALGLKIGKIVIDPGHGGYDAGTVGPNGLMEKDLVLDVSRRLGKLLDTRLGAEVEYTRRDDTFIPLETRTAIANQDRADLFVSVHANSSRDPDARGVETYYLNFTSSAEALELAARENAVSDKSIHELQDLVKKIALKEKIEESREFASNVDSALHSGLVAKNPGLRDRGVKKAPFIVLIGANMPSILAEISFVSNPEDERRLQTSEYRQRIAESLYRGIAKYVGGLSGVKVASKIEKTAGQ
jgi:N-acetylmuramoyl-L-alanine amidase